jgi:hypothetical protein
MREASRMAACGKRRVWRWLDDDGIAGSDRGNDVPARDEHRKVPGRDGSDDPDRLAVKLDTTFVAVLKYLDGNLEGARAGGPRLGATDLPPGTKALQRLALLERKQPSQFFDLFAEPVRDLLTSQLSNVVADPAPPLKGMARSSHGRVDVALRSERHLADHFARRGIAHFVSRPNLDLHTVDDVAERSRFYLAHNVHDSIQVLPQTVSSTRV